jgi:hypothetical protein
MQNATAAKPIVQFPSAKNHPHDLADLVYRKLLSCKNKKIFNLLIHQKE